MNTIFLKFFPTGEQRMVTGHTLSKNEDSSYYLSNASDRSDLRRHHERCRRRVRRTHCSQRSRGVAEGAGSIEVAPRDQRLLRGPPPRPPVPPRATPRRSAFVH